jgi:hypothetical protein
MLKPSLVHKGAVTGRLLMRILAPVLDLEALMAPADGSATRDVRLAGRGDHFAGASTGS